MLILSRDGNGAVLLRQENLLRKAVKISAIFFSVTFLLAQTPTTAKKKAPAKSTTKKTASTKKSSSKKAPAKSAPSWRNTQRTPTPERYKDIQQALATKGYLQTGSPNGVWDNSSVEALKKFQQDQNLEPSGKIDSLSLIALGLGPRRDTQAPPLP
jgi:peptidoglycan hydrolase-like protein with peptidoglycan-binding domain